MSVPKPKRMADKSGQVGGAATAEPVGPQAHQSAAMCDGANLIVIQVTLEILHGSRTTVRRNHGLGAVCDDVARGRSIGVRDIDDYAQMVTALDDGSAKRRKTRHLAAAHGQPAGIALPRQTGRSELVISQVHKSEDAHASLSQFIDAVQSRTEAIGPFDSEDDSQLAGRPTLANLRGRSHDAHRTTARPTSDSAQLGVDGRPRAARPPHRGDRIADGHHGDRMDADAVRLGECRGGGHRAVGNRAQRCPSVRRQKRRVVNVPIDDQAGAMKASDSRIGRLDRARTLFRPS